MSSAILTTGITSARFHDILRSGFAQSKPAAFGVAVAYVSVSGFQCINELVKKHRVRQYKLVADTRDAITHPLALETALDEGWDVRTVDDLPGTFHPKLYIGGGGFGKDCVMKDATFVVAGSANLSAAALNRNGECSYVDFGSQVSSSASKAWMECWHAGQLLNAKRLSLYAKEFEARNRRRQAEDLVALGVADHIIPVNNGHPSKAIRPPTGRQRTIHSTAAAVAWAGLE